MNEEKVQDGLQWDRQQWICGGFLLHTDLEGSGRVLSKQKIRRNLNQAILINRNK